MGALGGSMWPKIAALVLVISLLLHLISFGAPHWCKTNEMRARAKEHIGIWRFCSYPVGGSEHCSDFIDYTSGDWLKAAQSFMTLAMFALMGAIGAVAVYAFVPDFEGDMRVLSISLAVVGVAGLFMLIGTAVFGGMCHQYFDTKQPSWYGVSELDWAFFVAVVSLVGIFVSLGLLVMDIIAPTDDY